MSYTAAIQRSDPTAFLFLVDQSGSMSDKMAGEKTKAQFVADVLNRTLMNLVTRCAKSEGVRNYFDIGVLGYGGSGTDNGFVGSVVVSQQTERCRPQKKKASEGDILPAPTGGQRPEEVSAGEDQHIAPDGP